MCESHKKLMVQSHRYYNDTAWVMTHPNWMANILGPKQNDDISQMKFSNAFSRNKMFDSNLVQIWPLGAIDIMSPLVQTMAWRRTGAKPLPDPGVTQSNDAYMPQWANQLIWEFIGCAHNKETIPNSHHCWASRQLKSPVTWLFVQQFPILKGY